MKITIVEDSELGETEILIRCKKRDSKIEQIVNAVNALNFSLNVFKGERHFKIPVDDVLYIESVDDRTFIYSETEFFESNMKLYEIENLIEKFSFARISKSVIVNIKKITFIKPQLNGRFEAQLVNGFKQIVNRHYAVSLKEKFSEVFEK